MSDCQRMVGMRQLIRSAPGVELVRKFLAEVKTFKQVSPKTVRRCERAAALRINQLKLNQPNGN